MNDSTSNDSFIQVLSLIHRQIANANPSSSYSFKHFLGYILVRLIPRPHE